MWVLVAVGIVSTVTAARGVRVAVGGAIVGVKVGVPVGGGGGTVGVGGVTTAVSVGGIASVSVAVGPVGTRAVSVGCRDVGCSGALVGVASGWVDGSAVGTAVLVIASRVNAAVADGIGVVVRPGWWAWAAGRQVAPGGQALIRALCDSGKRTRRFAFES